MEDVDEKQDEAMPEPVVEIQADVQMNAHAGEAVSGDVRSDAVSQSLTKTFIVQIFVSHPKSNVIFKVQVATSPNTNQNLKQLCCVVYVSKMCLLGFVITIPIIEYISHQYMYFLFAYVVG